MEQVKSYNIPKQTVMDAWKLVKKNAGSAGIDEISITEFEANLKSNLYKIWNRMASGSYMPPEVKAVPIPKKSGGFRVLGIPTVADRVAQTVVKIIVEPQLEKIFYPDSYGYRPLKSAHEAIGITRQRCWKYNWVLEFDIRGLFDNLSHELLMKAVRHHIGEKWCVLYIDRWLKAGAIKQDNIVGIENSGTPQGGVISPCLSNLFMHYAFDRWLSVNYPSIPWCRYADDGLLHCRTKLQAEKILHELTKRLAECKLEIHPEKTKIIYCKDANRKGEHQCTEFTFLGYTFKQRLVKNARCQLFMNFIPAMGDSAWRAIKVVIKYKWKLALRTNLSLEEMAKAFNPTIRGWIQYYGKFNKSSLAKLSRYLNLKLCKWFRKKYQNKNNRKISSYAWLKRVFKSKNRLFAHWAHWKVA